ncbi:AraC family transcriptional regulator [Xanthocytophaga agilis]|uniref:AraC family transcriptional regulator n=1 Tax=Xanthocytophaga agilis TaxID=3048010 RepID=A0AAE3R5F9_9BACT|nr:AraC family transcriptional regulator [Xanthocytophaga agilis]MDJ1501784.1 AraC family transcriptional regulator [Xanthocytophaga agilis]
MATPKIPTKIFVRQHEITATFLQEIDKHLADIISGKVTEMFEIRDIADIMHIHPTHLSNTIKLTTGKPPCYFFEEKILDIAKTRLRETSDPIAEIAIALTYDPSNFVKFFKRFTGLTPKQYREEVQREKFLSKTELVTI